MHGRLLPHQRLRNRNLMQRWQLLQLLVRQLHQSFHVQNTREHLAPLSHYRSLQPQVWAGDVCVAKETRNELPNNLVEWSLHQRKLQREPIKQSAPSTDATPQTHPTAGNNYHWSVSASLQHTRATKGRTSSAEFNWDGGQRIEPP